MTIASAISIRAWAYIEAQARECGLQNQVRGVTCDMSTFEINRIIKESS